MYKILILLTLPLLLFSRLQITTHLPFEAAIIKKIAMNHVRVKIITTKYYDKTLEFKYSEISKFANTKAFLHFGLDVEKQYEEMIKNHNSKSISFDMSKGINKLTYQNKKNHFIWLDPILLRDVASNIYNFLIKHDHLNKDNYKRNYEAFLADMDSLYLKIRNKLYSSEIYNIIVLDEYFRYFANRFSLNLYRKDKKVVEANEIKELLSYVEKNEIKLVLVNDDGTYIFGKSLAGNGKISLEKLDVYDEYTFRNLLNLAKSFAK